VVGAAGEIASCRRVLEAHFLKVAIVDAIRSVNAASRSTELRYDSFNLNGATWVA
jgi:hypothetical protein